MSSQPCLEAAERPLDELASPAARLRVLLAGSAILFLAVGARQGFGLLMAPAMVEPGLSRAEFSVAVATQYLVWGIVGPLAGHAAQRWGQRRVLFAGGLCYALGFLAAAAASGFHAFWWGAGILIGLGLGGASFGVVHAAVAQAWPPAKRGTALGIVGAFTALGQLLLLVFTDWALQAFSLPVALAWHAGAVALILPLACAIGPRRASQRAVAPAGALRSRLTSSAFLSLALPFAASGFQVMATMTHLPAMAADTGLGPATALHALIAVSATAFAGSWAFGQLADRHGPARLLAVVYGARAVLAGALVALPAQPAFVLAYFAVVGLFWMSPIPLTSALCAERFGTDHLAMLFGVAFFFHQLGGFLGTWLAAPLRQHTGSYSAMWLLCALLCAAAAACVLGSSRTSPQPPSQ